MPAKGAPRPQSHQSGDFGERLVASILPSEWVIHSYKGSEDYGIDLHVEIFAHGQPTGLEFGISVKTTERFPYTKPPKVHISVNNLTYMMSKIYPTMIVVVSRREKKAVFTWIGELFTVEDIFNTVGVRSDGSKNIRVALSPNYNLSEEADGIVDYAVRVKENLGFWYNEEINRRIITDLYLDLHSALDALVECELINRSAEFSESEKFHKYTYTGTIVIASYFLIREITTTGMAKQRDPAVAALIIICGRLRVIVSKLVSEEALLARENGSDGQDGSLFVLPNSGLIYSYITPLLVEFRDILRLLSVFLAPWRDFNIRMSGLATSVIDFRDPA